MYTIEARELLIYIFFSLSRIVEMIVRQLLGQLEDLMMLMRLLISRCGSACSVRIRYGDILVQFYLS